MKIEKLQNLINNLENEVKISDKNWESKDRNEYQIVSRLQETLEYAIWVLERIRDGKEDEI